MCAPILFIQLEIINMNQKLFIFGLFFTMAYTVFAQNQRIEGRITDATTNAPLMGAKIKINNGNTITTDDAGQFAMPCADDLELAISYVGYKTYTTEITSCGVFLNILMVPTADDLAEVQLMGSAGQDRELLRYPVSVVELDKRELKRGTGLYLDDAINANVPGVIMQRRAVSSGQQFNIRGYGNGVGFRGASNNFDGQGYKVYLNNIPITDAEGVTQLDDIDFSSIGEVEVIKGPAGTRYGLAIAGAVNLQTVRPQPGEISLGQSVTAGRYGLLRLTSQLQMGGENTSLLLNYGHQVSDGYMSHADSQKDFVNAMVDFRPSARQYISTYFGYSNSYDERGGELSVDQFEAKDYTVNARYIKNNAHSEVVSFRAGLSHNYIFNNWLSNTSTVFGSGANTNASSAGGWTDKDPINYGLRTSFDFNFNLGENLRLTGSAGAELQEQRAAIIGYRMEENPADPEGYNIIGNTRSNQYARSGTSSFFTEWMLHLPANFSVTAGLGLSTMQIDLEDRLYDPESARARNVSADYKDLYSPHVAINKVFNDNVSVYASYSKAYNAPVSGNIAISTTGELNTRLVPEIGNQFEIGSKGNIFDNKLHYQLAFFNAVFKNKFTSVAVPLDQNTTAYTYIANGGKQEHKGVEFLAKYTAYESVAGFFSSIDPYANATYSHFRYADYQYESLGDDGSAITVDYSDKAVAGIAPWVVNTGVDFNTNPGIYGNVNYSFRDTMPFTSDGANRTDAYHLLNAKLGYRTSFDQLTSPFLPGQITLRERSIIIWYF
jgi:iron complex outermembrane receptor protein